MKDLVKIVNYYVKIYYAKIINYFDDYITT